MKVKVQLLTNVDFLVENPKKIVAEIFRIIAPALLVTIKYKFI